LVTGAIRFLTDALCKINDAEVTRVPERGPLILVINHINFLDIPVMYTRLLPRPFTGYAKHESWDNILKRGLIDVWGGFPLHRGEPDMAALRWGLEVLRAGYILAIAPEGTRSGHGRLQEAHPGVVFLALRSGVPLLPVVYYGNEDFWDNLPKLKRTEVNLAVGRPFRLESGGEKVTQEVRQQMIEEVMYQLAGLMPSEYRGVYADESQWTEKYLRFE
jgi:1-acyl-sn-glycerol-3-phosphate acyltransferase